MRIHELTGPALAPPRRAVRETGDALGEPVRLEELNRAEARALTARFMPGPVVGTTLGIPGTPAPAEQRVSPDVERLLGREPGTFAGWAHRRVAAFR